MYNIENKKAAIKQIQKMLFLNETGVSNNDLTDKVKEVQSKKGVTPSGKVDYITFLLIKSDYENKCLKDSMEHKTLCAFPYKKGDKGNAIAKINSMIFDIIKNFPLEIPFEKSGYFSDKTEKVVIDLRKKFNFEIVPYIDEKLWQRIELEIESLSLLKKNNDG